MSWPPAGNFRVRNAATADAERLAELRLRLQQTLEQESPALWRMTAARKAALPAFYRDSLLDPEVRVLVAELDGPGGAVIVGTAVGRLAAGRDVAKFGSIEDVWVEPAERGRGICRALLQELGQFFEREGVTQLTLGFAYAGSAAPVWQRLGFQPAVVIANATLHAVLSGGSKRAQPKAP